MASKSATLPAGIIHLQKLLTHLKAPPKLVLTGVKTLRMSLAAKNDHFGAR
jgi:small subunit ribosomal protein S25